MLFQRTPSEVDIGVIAVRKYHIRVRKGGRRQAIGIGVCGETVHEGDGLR